MLGFMTVDINLLVNVVLAVFVIPTSAGVFKLNREVGELREAIKYLKENFSNNQRSQ